MLYMLYPISSNELSHLFFSFLFFFDPPPHTHILFFSSLSLLVLIPVYVVAGCIYNHRKYPERRPIEKCPNLAFWKDLPVLVKVCRPVPVLFIAFNSKTILFSKNLPCRMAACLRSKKSVHALHVALAGLVMNL